MTDFEAQFMRGVIQATIAAERERIRLAVEALERCDSGCEMGQYVDVDEVLAAIGGNL